MKEEWRGIKDMEKLVGLSGIQDIDFVHASGFIGGAVTRDSTVRMGGEVCDFVMHPKLICLLFIIYITYNICIKNLVY